MKELIRMEQYELCGCPTTLRKRLEPLASRFAHRVVEYGECLVWTGAMAHGYGVLTLHTTGPVRHNILAHRLAWFLDTGVVPKLNVLHKCDRPACVNINHLFLGTQADNMRDMFKKGRANVNTFAAIMTKMLRTHCRKGHPYDMEDTSRCHDGSRCKVCFRQRKAREA